MLYIYKSYDKYVYNLIQYKNQFVLNLKIQNKFHTIESFHSFYIIIFIYIDFFRYIVLIFNKIILFFNFFYI